MQNVKDQKIKPYKPVRLSPRIIRTVADNGSFMTGPGTNTYLVGHEELVVIDPGPADSRHVRSIIKAVEPGCAVKWICVTHTHPDHSPAAKMLQNETGAPILGMPTPGGISQDYGFAPDRVLNHHERIQTDAFSLQVIHTPGHASNHLCFLLEDEKLLFTGDHIMQGSTVVIIPPYGNMRDYLTSLDNLKGYDIDWIAPGHGYLINTPEAEINGIINHRLQREAKVISALKRFGHADLDQLVAPVYDDTPVFKHFVAQFSLEAHLMKLEADGVVIREGNGWRYLV